MDETKVRAIGPVAARRECLTEAHAAANRARESIGKILNDRHALGRRRIDDDALLSALDGIATAVAWLVWREEVYDRPDEPPTPATVTPRPMRSPTEVAAEAAVKRSKLTTAQKAEIEAHLRSGNHSQGEIARHFGVSKHIVQRLHRGVR